MSSTSSTCSPISTSGLMRAPTAARKRQQLLSKSMCMPRSIRTAAVYLAAAVLFMLLAVSGAQACPVTVTPPAGATLERSVFAVTEFANLTYHDSFSGQVGQTATWPGEMGWQGDRIDVGFIVP